MNHTDDKVSGRSMRVDVQGEEKGKGKGGDKDGKGKDGKGEGATVFVGGVSFRATEDDVRRLFENAGYRLQSLRMPLDMEKGQPRGFAFVEFASSHEAPFESEMASEATQIDGWRPVHRVHRGRQHALVGAVRWRAAHRNARLVVHSLFLLDDGFIFARWFNRSMLFITAP